MKEIEYLLGEKDLLEGNLRASRLRCEQLQGKLDCVNDMLEEHTKLNKEKFLKTEFGENLECMITTWDQALEKNSRTGEDEENLKTLVWCQAQWEVYRLTIKHFYGVEYHFTRTDEYYGLCTEDESDWLMRVERMKVCGMETTFSRQRVTRRGIRINGVEYWDANFVHLNLGKTIIAECTPWLIRVYTEAGTPLHIFCR